MRPNRRGCMADDYAVDPGAMDPRAMGVQHVQGVSRPEPARQWTRPQACQAPAVRTLSVSAQGRSHGQRDGVRPPAHPPATAGGRLVAAMRGAGAELCLSPARARFHGKRGVSGFGVVRVPLPRAIGLAVGRELAVSSHTQVLSVCYLECPVAVRVYRQVEVPGEFKPNV